jgi:hypothetical protein
MAYKENVKNISVAAAADLSANQYKFGLIGATGVALNTTSGGPVDGVIQEGVAVAGEAETLGVSGVSKVVAGAAITAGAPVMSNATGLAITATATNLVVGKAITAATASGNVISVLLDTKYYLSA